LPAQDTKPHAGGEAAAAAGSKDLPGGLRGINRCVRGFRTLAAYKSFRICYHPAAPRLFNQAPREFVMAKGQMRSNKEKKKPKADKNLKKGGAAPSPFASGKTPAGQAPNKKG
jgi:hypothetical protein